MTYDNYMKHQNICMKKKFGCLLNCGLQYASLQEAKDHFL